MLEQYLEEVGAAEFADVGAAVVTPSVGIEVPEVTVKKSVWAIESSIVFAVE